MKVNKKGRKAQRSRPGLLKQVADPNRAMPLAQHLKREQGIRSGVDASTQLTKQPCRAAGSTGDAEAR